MIKPKYKISKMKLTAEQYEKIRSDAEACKEILTNPKFAFFVEYLRGVQSEIVDKFVKNRIKTVEVKAKVGDTEKTFIEDKETEYNELSGQYKLVDTIFEDLKACSEYPDEIKKAQEKGTIEITES